MSPISNFTQAMKELTGFDDEPVKDKAKTSPQAEEDAVKYEESFAMPRSEQPSRQHLTIDMPAFDGSTGTTVTGTMVITGSVEGTDPVKVDGKISGDLHTAAAAVVNGKIIGNVTADNLMISGSIKGDVTAGADTRIESSAIIVGNVQSGNLSVRGKIKGNLQIKAVTEVTGTAVIVGSTETGELNSERGCVINGSVITRNAENFNFDDEKLFRIGE